MSARAFTACVLMTIAQLASAAELGRMFFTPTQRAALDTARKQNVRIELGNDENERAPTTPSTAAPASQTVRFSGLIQRSDGKSTVWLNNKPITDKMSGGLNISTVRGDTRVKLTAPDGGRSMDLKVGQTAEMVSGTIEEGYKRRPAPKSEEKPPLPIGGNDVSAVQKRTADTAADSLESSSRLQRQPRAASRDARDEAPAGGTDTR
jgi:hypothetical protein